MRADLNGHAARNFAHRGETGQASVWELNRLVGDSDHAVVHKSLRELRLRSEVKVRDQDLASLEERVLLRQRLLHLDDHIRLLEDAPMVIKDFSACFTVLLVSDSAPKACARLDQDPVAALCKLFDAGRDHRDAVFAVHNLFWNADYHNRCTSRPFVQ